MLFSALVLAGGALALSRPDCFVEHGRALAAYSDCADHDALAPCFTGLSSHSVDDVEACLITAGCSPSTALIEAREALDRCDEWARASDLRRRVRAYVPHMPARTVNPFAHGSGSSPNPRATDNAGAMALNRLFGRQDDEGKRISGDDCFDLTTKDTSDCDVSTDGPNLVSSNCKPATVVESSCKQGLTCSMDNTGTNVCMELHDTLTTAGIIISIVFAAAIVLGIASLTYLCCQDRRQQKRLVAKAEATALARAATKKQRSKEVRAPLMAQQDDQPPQIHAPLGGNDPFGDQNRS
jgi:hypothetical protein